MAISGGQGGGCYSCACVLAHSAQPRLLNPTLTCSNSTLMAGGTGAGAGDSVGTGATAGDGAGAAAGARAGAAAGDHGSAFLSCGGGKSLSEESSENLEE
jgi:hypothetical protein